MGPREEIAMGRASIVLCAILLFAWGTGQARFISFTGEKQFDVFIRDADRVEVLTALFATSRGGRVMLLSDGVAGRIDRLQLSQAPFDAVLEAILGEDYRYETGTKEGVVVYRISNPAVAPVVVTTLEPAVEPSVPVLKSRYTTVLTITSRSGDGIPYPGGGTLTRSSRQIQPARNNTFGIHYTETIPFIVMNESFDPFGRIIRAPQIYYQRFGAGFDINGSRMHSYFYDNGNHGRRHDYQHGTDSNHHPGAGQPDHRDDEHRDDRGPDRDRDESRED